MKSLLFSVLKNEPGWKLGKRVFPGMQCVLVNRSECLNTFIVGEGHYNSRCHQQPCGGLPSVFQHCDCPASAPCHVKVFFKCLVLLASLLMRHHHVQVAGQILHCIAAKWSLNQHQSGVLTNTL